MPAPLYALLRSAIAAGSALRIVAVLIAKFLRRKNKP
jgi:hypothetical protein